MTEKNQPKFKNGETVCPFGSFKEALVIGVIFYSDGTYGYLCSVWASNTDTLVRHIFNECELKKLEVGRD